MVTVTNVKARQKKKTKKKTLAKQADDVAVKIQKLVRMKAADDNGYVYCVDGCGAYGHWKEMQGGHYIPRGYTSTKLIEENIHPQAPGCNFRMSHGDTQVTEGYRRALVDMYGEEFIEELVALSRQTKKWDRLELSEMNIDIDRQIREQLQRLGDV